jgi:predicted nucleotidyltransferase
MRLTNYEILSIKKVFEEVFGNGKIYLFGSRIDDTKRGGDIDLYIDLDTTLTIKEQMNLKTSFRLRLYDLIGEQKIDIVISKDKNRSIEKEILKTGVIL